MVPASQALMLFPLSAGDIDLRVLVVDDEKNIRTTLSVCLEASAAK